MLKKKNRADRKTIEQIFKSGRAVRGASLTFRFLRGAGALGVQISFIVPKNISKKATERNKLRRRGYQILGKYIDKLPAGLAGVFIFKKRQDDALKLEHEIKNIVSKIN